MQHDNDNGLWRTEGFAIRVEAHLDPKDGLLKAVNLSTWYCDTNEVRIIDISAAFANACQDDVTSYAYSALFFISFSTGIDPYVHQELVEIGFSEDYIDYMANAAGRALANVFDDFDCYITVLSPEVPDGSSSDTLPARD